MRTIADQNEWENVNDTDPLVGHCEIDIFMKIFNKILITSHRTYELRLLIYVYLSSLLLSEFSLTYL